jgi:hypothetical protein
MIDCLFFCGCSFTYGEELNESIRQQKNFAGLLGKHYNIPVYNFSKPAGSNDRIQRKTFIELPKLLQQGLTPMVIIPWTQPHRREIFDIKKNMYRNINFPGGKFNLIADEFDTLYFTKYSVDDDDALRTVIIKLSMQSFLKQLLIPYLFIESFASVPKLPNSYYHMETLLDKQYIIPTNLRNIYKGCEMAPGGHPLEQGHQLIADYLIKEIDQTHKGIL